MAVGLAATAAVGMSLFPALPLGAAAGAALGLLAGRLAGGARAATNGKAHPTLALVVIAQVAVVGYLARDDLGAAAGAVIDSFLPDSAK